MKLLFKEGIENISLVHLRWNMLTLVGPSITTTSGPTEFRKNLAVIFSFDIDTNRAWQTHPVVNILLTTTFGILLLTI